MSICRRGKSMQKQLCFSIPPPLSLPFFSSSSSSTRSWTLNKKPNKSCSFCARFHPAPATFTLNPADI